MSDLVGTILQVAEALETSDDSIRWLKKNAGLPHVYINRKEWVVPWFALNEWLAAQVAANTNGGRDVESDTSTQQVSEPPSGEVNGAPTYTATEAASLLGMSKATLYRAINRGDIIAIRFGRAVQIPRHVVDRLLEQGNEPPPSVD